MSGLTDSNATDQNDFGIFVIADTDTPSNKMKVNNDGSVNTVSVAGYGDCKSLYSEVSSVAASTLTSVVTYTVPVGKTAFLQAVAFSGTNIAEYQVFIDATLEDKKRTWFSGGLDSTFQFSTENAYGIPLIAGNVINLKVIHSRPFVGDFNGRIQLLEI